MTLDIDPTPDAGVAGAGVVSARGDLDLATVVAFRADLNDQLTAGTSQVVVDLSEVTFIDSTAVGALVTASRALQRRGGSLLLVCRTSRVLRVLEITGLDTVLPVHGSVDEALAACADTSSAG
jgi:anti-sigma B factor antagonist